MAKLQLQLNGQKGLAPKHFGNSLYSTNDPHLKYIGSAGQSATGVFWSDRYNGYMSPLPNQYQDLIVIGDNDTNVSNSAIKMAFTDRKDTGASIVFADDTGLYKAQITPTIDGVTGAFDFHDGYSTPVYDRTFGENFVTYNSYNQSTSTDTEMIHMSGNYYVSVYSVGTVVTIKTFKLEDKVFEELDSETLPDTSFYDVNKYSDTQLLFAYAVNGGGGKIKRIQFSEDFTSIFLGSDVFDYAFESISLTDNFISQIEINSTVDSIYVTYYKALNTDQILQLLSYDGNIISALDSQVLDSINSYLEQESITDSNGNLLLAYQNSNNNKGYLKIINQALSTVDTYEFQSSVAQNMKLLPIDNNNYYIYYHDLFSAQNTIKTINVDSSLNITEVESISYDSDNIESPQPVFISPTYVFAPYTDATAGDGGFVAFTRSGTTLTNAGIYQPITLPENNMQLLLVGTDDLILSYTDVEGLNRSMYINNYVDYLSSTAVVKASDITDVTRSQFAGASSYYYIWGDQIGRASSLANIGTEVDSTNTVYWIARSNNTNGLAKLRAPNPHFINTKNQYVYILDGSAIHGINISSSGITEDIDGTLDSDLIIFQSGVNLIDGVDNNENIYLSMVEGDDNVDLWNLPSDTSTGANCYVYVWNKISGQQLQANRIELTDCKHVGKMFVQNGNVYAMTINSGNISEIRMMGRGGFEVIHELGSNGEFNIGKRSVVTTDLGVMIATNKGNLFLLDKNNELKKLGTFATDIDSTQPALIIYGGGEGHEPSNTAQGLQSVVPHVTIAYRQLIEEDFLSTQDLNFIMTEDNNYIIT